MRLKKWLKIFHRRQSGTWWLYRWSPPNTQGESNSNTIQSIWKYWVRWNSASLFFLKWGQNYFDNKTKDMTQAKKPLKSRSFMNTDAMIFNEILASQIQSHTKKIIYHDQVEHIPEMQGWFNTHQSTMSQITSVEWKTNSMVISKNREKHLLRFNPSSW